MPKTTITDPRAEFAALSDDELRDELHVATERARIALGNASRPTRDGIEAKLATAQQRARSYFDKLAARAMDAALNAVPGSASYRALEDAALAAFIASGGFAD